MAVALQAVVAAGGLLGALLCGGACQGLDGVVGLGAVAVGVVGVVVAPFSI